jgi:Gluconate 2-dehydrogenase subunit 3
MQRRNALKSLSAGFGAMIALPTWANSWNENSFTITNSVFTKMEENTLAVVVTTIIPEGKIPGAKSLGVPTYINKIVTDCYEPKAQTDFKTGLENVEKIAQSIHSKSFEACDNAQRMSVLKAMESSADSAKKAFITQIKNITVQGYTTRETIMVNHLKYVMAPGHYYGCISV